MNMADEGEKYIIRIRGLPWSATDAEIVGFLENVTIVNGQEGIHKTYTREGRPSGEAYVEVLTERDMQNAISKDHETMGRRYIEVFKSTQKEMEYVLGRSGVDNAEQDNSDGVVRCRGLPFQCSKEEIAQFFSGLEIVPNGITISTSNGRSTGEAFVQFANQGIAEQALSKHKHKIGHRYIEIFKSTKAEIRQSMGDSRMGRNNPRRGPYDRPVRDGRAGMRGGGGGYGGRSVGSRGGRMMGGYGSYGGGDYYDDDYEYGGGMGGSYGSRGRGGGAKGYSYGKSRDDGLYGGDGYGNGNGNDFVVHMRGLPFRANENDISMFFSPLVPVNIYLEYGKDGRLNGEADVSFGSYGDAQSAMKKDRATMQHRYIELFARFDESESCGGGYDYRGGMGYNNNSGGQGMGYDDDYGMRGGANYKQF